MTTRLRLSAHTIWSRLQATARAAVSRDAVAESDAAQESSHWTCTYEHESGMHASAIFDSARKALDFADHHAQLTARSRGEWEQIGDMWLLTTDCADYLVRPQPAPTERPSPAAPKP